VIRLSNDLTYRGAT